MYDLRDPQQKALAQFAVLALLAEAYRRSCGVESQENCEGYAGVRSTPPQEHSDEEAGGDSRSPEQPDPSGSCGADTSVVGSDQGDLVDDPRVAVGSPARTLAQARAEGCPHRTPHGQDPEQTLHRLGRSLFLPRGHGQQYDRDDRKVTMRDPRAIGADKETFSIYYTYDDLGRLTKADQPPVPSQTRASTSFEYDARGNATQQTDPDGKVTKWTYDSRNRKTSQTTGTGSLSIIHAWGYDAVGNKTKDIAVSTLNVDHPEDSTGLMTSTQYDAVNRPIEVDAPDGQKTFTIYDELGRVKTTQDAQGNTTSYFYNSLNKATEVDQPLSKTTKNTYNVWGDATSTQLLDTDTGDQLWVRGYNAWGQVNYEVNNAGQAWTYQYNQRGLVKTSTDPNGTTATTGYRVTGQPTSRTLTKGSTTQHQSWDYDTAGTLKTATDGNVVTQINQSTGSFAPNPYDLVTSYSTQVLGKTLNVATTYDNGERPVTLTYPDTTPITNTYNDLGQLTGINGFASNGTYDFAGHLTELDATNGTGRTKTWNTATGNLDGYQWTGTTSAARSLTWDNLGNLTAQTKDNNTSSYGYDALNRLTYAQEGGAVEVNTKDSSGTQYMSKIRDVAGRLSMNYSTASVQLDAAATSVGIDLGSVQQINKVRLTAASNRVSPRTLEVYLSSLGTSKSWTKATDVTLVPDNTGTTLEFAASHSARFVKVHMTWDERDAGNQSLSTGSTISGTPAQLIQVWFTVNGQMTTWSYDSLGNRLSQTQIRGIANQTTTAYYPYTNLIKTNGTWEFNYDANGNMTQRGTNGTWNSTLGRFDWATSAGELWIYSYDLSNRLVGVSHGTSGTTSLQAVATYTYDSRNLRVASTKNGKTTYYQYDPSGDLIWSDDGATQIKYVQALGQTWAEVRTVGGVDTKYWHSVDHEGSTELITDNNANVVWSGAYEAFGSLVRSNGTLDFTPSYTGKQFDNDTGLYYYNARWYEPSLGRFMTEDPARDGNDWEVYAGDSPLVYSDPQGKAMEASIAYGKVGWTIIVAGGGPEDVFTDIAYAGGWIVALGIDAWNAFGPQIAAAVDDFGPQIPALIDNVQNALGNMSPPSPDPGGWDPKRFTELVNKVKDKLLKGLSDFLDKSHLDAARAEKLGQGNTWPSGKPMDHYQEVVNGLKGVSDQIDKLKGALNNPKMTDDVRKATLELIKELTEMSKQMTDYINGK